MTDLVIAPADVAPVEVLEQASGYAAEDIDAGQYVRLNTTSGSVELGNGSSAAEARKGGIALNTVKAGQAVTFVRKGLLDLGAALAALTFDDDVFLSDTDGTLADAAGTVSLIVGTVQTAYGQGGPGVSRAKLLRVDL